MQTYTVSTRMLKTVNPMTVFSHLESPLAVIAQSVSMLDLHALPFLS
jgi:hypothetical protein